MIPLALPSVLRRCLCILGLLIAHALLPVQAAPADIGVVLLHGKWGTPNQMQALSRDLEARGYRTSTPEMTWSGKRLYDRDYAAALKEIETAVRDLRARGIKRVVVAGQSLGANGAAAYAASGLHLDGLVLMAPGHFPDRGMGGKPLQDSLERARAMVAAGQGEAPGTFLDFNQGRQRQLSLKAAVYVSFFEPEGLGAMTRNVPRFVKPLPLLLAIGTQDVFHPYSKAMFDSAPAHPLSHYASLEADHLGLPNLVSAEMLKWLDRIDSQAARP